MAKVTPEQGAQKWSTRLSGATEEITRGVGAVQTAPGQLAAAQRQKWLTAINENADKWQRNVGRVTLEQWRDKMINVGIPRIAQGAQQNMDKVQSFFSEFFPHLDRGVQSVKQMPSNTFEERVNRAVAMMRHNRQFKRGGTPGAR